MFKKLILLVVSCSNIHAMDFHDAARTGCYDRVMEILRGGVNVNMRDPLGQTPLLLAAANGHQEIVRELLQVPGIDVNEPDYSDDSPLHFAACHGCHAIVHMLLQKPEISVNMRNKNGWTALFWAAANGCQKVVYELLQAKDIDVHADTNDGDTPLRIAIKHKYCEIEQMIRKYY